MQAGPPKRSGLHQFLERGKTSGDTPGERMKGERLPSMVCDHGRSPDGANVYNL